MPIYTATLGDGEHAVRLFTEDYGQYQGLYGTKGETCTQRNVLTDNTAPGAPSGLAVTSANLQRYLPDVGAPIDAVRYQVLNGAGTVVVPTKTIAGDNVQGIENIDTANDRGSFNLKLWLADAEGNVGAPVTAPLSYECVRSTIGRGQANRRRGR